MATPKTSIARNQNYVYEYLRTHACVDCGETDPLVLQFDHDDHQDKTHKISYMVNNYSIESIEDEIAKCTVRCANCHQKKTLRERGAYKYLLSEE